MTNIHENNFNCSADSYSDNGDLSTATKRLENALDSILRVEEQKRTKAQWNVRITDVIFKI